MVSPDGVLYVSGDGDDANPGTAEQPFRTITRALSFTPGLTEIRVGAGLYDAAAGETFPLNVPAGVSIIGAVGPNEDATDSVLLDCGGAAQAVVLGATPIAGGEEEQITGLLKGLVIANALPAVIDCTSWVGTIEGCVIKDAADVAAADGSDTALMYSDSGTVQLSIVDTTVKDITATANHYLIRLLGSGSVEIDGSLFRNITMGNIQGKKAAINLENMALTLTDSTFDTITFGYSGTWAIEESGFIMSWYNSCTIDRCVFSNFDAGCGLVNSNRATGICRNSLFYNIDNKGYGTVRGFFSSMTVYNCTFDRCNTAFTTDGYNNDECVYNSIVTNSVLNGNASKRLIFRNCDLYNCDPGAGYDVDSSTGNISVDPLYENPYDPGADPENPLPPTGNEDYHLNTYSPVVDGGNNDNVGPGDLLDLDGADRILDGDGIGDALVDLGAYESNYYNQTAPKFRADYPVYSVFAGSSIDIDVYVDPAAGGAVTADVAYGADLSGAASLNIGDGAGPVVLTVSAASPMTVPSGTLSVVTLTESSARGVAAGEIGVYIYDNRVTIGGETRLYVSQGVERQIKVSMATAAPSALNITPGAPAGAGTNAIAWVGGTTIPEGASESAGYLSITGDSGINTIDLTIDGGFVFSETGTATVTITVIGYVSPLYVSENGDDETGDGTLANPLRTITLAASLLLVRKCGCCRARIAPAAAKYCRSSRAACALPAA